MNHQPNPQVASERRRVIDQARASIEACRNLLAEAGLTPDACLETLRRTEGDAAVERIRCAVAESLQGFREQVQRESMHNTSLRPVSRYAARRGFV